MRTKIIFILSLFLTVVLLSCNDGFLEAKPDKAMVVPRSLADFQALMDYYDQVNRTTGLPEFAADDYYVPDGELEFEPNTVKNTYMWKADIFEGEDSYMAVDWTNIYQQVLKMNVVLDGLKDLDRDSENSALYDEVKGAALFYRSFYFFSLAQTFALGYNPSSASSELGIPLKLSSDINELVGRASLKQTYDQIINDLKEAEVLLPEQVAFTTRPAKAAVQALLARTYLVMGWYEEADDYASKVLEDHDELIDFNELDLSARFPRALPAGNKEIIFYSIQNLISVLFTTSAIVDNEVQAAYKAGDLRKQMYFSDSGNGRILFKGSYDGTGWLFSGLATDEVFLIKAECRVRMGDLAGGLDILNRLLRSRWDRSYVYVPLTAGDKMEALSIVLQERRKELIFRGLRWSDLRRLNLEPQFQKRLVRTYNQESFSLEPSSSKYAFPIPSTEIAANPYINQNIRE